MVAAGCAAPARPAADRPPTAAPLTADAYAHYLRGRLASFEGDAARAVRELRAASLAAPDEAPIRVALVEALYRSGDREGARAEIVAAAERWPDEPRVWRSRGRVHRGLRDHRAAARAFERAIELDPGDESAYLGLAAAWVALEEPRRAERTYRALLSRVPRSARGHHRLGRQLVARDPGAAERHLRRALELDPDRANARLDLARALRALGRDADAIAILRAGFDRSQGDVRVGEELFARLLEAGDQRGAVELIGHLDRDDLALETRVTFGYLYLRVGELRRAERLARTLRGRAPDSVEVLLLEARALQALGRGDEAVPALASVPARRRDSSRARALASEIRALAGDAHAALAIADEALAAAPDEPALLAARAFALEVGGQVERARAGLQRAIERSERDVDLRYALAALEERQGRPERAIEIIEVLLARDPADATALNYIGYSLADRGVELRRARKLLSRALALDPDNGFLLDSWGWLLFREGKLDAAETYLRRAARLAPAEPEILWHLGELRLARGDRDRALRLLERARRFALDRTVRSRIEARLGELAAASPR